MNNDTIMNYVVDNFSSYAESFLLSVVKKEPFLLSIKKIHPLQCFRLRKFDSNIKL